MFNITFNAQEVAPTMGMDPVPSGIYTVAIVKSEEVPVNGKPGCSRYRFDMQIQDGDYKGKYVWESLNIKNDNPQTVDIAYATLSAICHVTGVIQIGQSSAELHNRPFKVNVIKQQRNDDPSKEENKIRSYMDLAGNPPKAGGGNRGNGQATPAQAAAFATPAPQPSLSQPIQPSPMPQMAPAVAAPPAPAPAPAPAPTFPPEGWTLHPNAAGYYYKGQEVLSEAQLRAQMAPAPAPVTPAIPAAPGPTTAATPVMPSWAT